MNMHEVGVSITTEAEFAGVGSYIELPKQLLPHSRDDGEEIIKVTVTSERENGLLFWQGQTPTISGRGKDYIAIVMQNGFPVFRYCCCYAKQMLLALVGGVAQWLGHRSVAGGLSLIYA